MNFSEKTVLVTGGATGIGAATCNAFLDKGAIVYMLDIKEPLYSSHDNLHYINCDISSNDHIREAFRAIYQKTNNLDHAFLNAGIHMVGAIEDITPEDLDKIIDINIKGVFLCLKQLVPRMRETAKGSIVLMGSDQCHVGKGLSSVYGLTKGAIGQLTKSTAIDYAQFGIRINCVCPGSIDTPLLHGAVASFSSKTDLSEGDIISQVSRAQPIQRIGRPEEIAKTVLFLCSDDASFITGALLSVDGGYVAQ
jgi:NAD(P)-dependent dehydrogenase (short-subunit alcohol dehydrogenase family)